MEIIDLKISYVSKVNYFKLIDIKFKAGQFKIKDDNGKEYSNGYGFTITTNNEMSELKNRNDRIIFKNQKDNLFIKVQLKELEVKSNLIQAIEKKINLISDIAKKELDSLMDSINDFNLKNLIDKSLEENDKEMFMKLTTTLK